MKLVEGHKLFMKLVEGEKILVICIYVNDMMI